MVGPHSPDSAYPPYDGDWYDKEENMRTVISVLEHKLRTSNGRARHFVKHDLQLANAKLATILLTK